jgi:lysophospholipase L1-like esterase
MSGYGKRVVFALAPALILIAGLEALSYLYYRYALADDFMAIDISDSFQNIPDLFERRRTEAGDVLFSRYFPTRYYVSDRNYRGKSMAAEKTRQIFRVFTFGGSATAGSPWGNEASFSRFLEDELNALKRTGDRVEVVNFGGGGYGSTRALGLVEASIQYQPDLIVFYEGHNEMADNWIYQDVAHASVNTGIRRYADHLYTYKVARILLYRQMARPPERVDLLNSNATFIPKRIEEKKGFKAPDRRYLTDQFRQNLIGIIRAARAQGALVLLVSQPSNVFYQPSWFPADGDAEEARLAAELLAAYKRGDLPATQARAADVLKLNADNPVAHFYMGLIARQARDLASAREHLLAAIDYDESPERYTRAYRVVE